MVISTLAWVSNEEVVRVASEGEWRLDCLLDTPRSVPIFDPKFEGDLQRIESDSDLDAFKVSPLKIRLSEMKRGLIGILTESLWLFCSVSL